MPKTYTPIATATLETAQPYIDFTSISQLYTDLVIVTNIRCAEGSNHVYARWGNGSYDSNSNYSQIGLYSRSPGNNFNSVEMGTERTVDFDYARITPYVFGATSPSLTFGSQVINIMNYTNTSVFKTAIISNASNGSAQYRGLERVILMWRSTAAINQIRFSLPSGNFAAGSKVTLYGIKAA